MTKVFPRGVKKSYASYKVFVVSLFHSVDLLSIWNA